MCVGRVGGQVGGPCDWRRFVQLVTTTVGVVVADQLSQAMQGSGVSWGNCNFWMIGKSNAYYCGCDCRDVQGRLFAYCDMKLFHRAVRPLGRWWW